MKLISAFRAMGAAFALVVLGFFAHAAFVNDAPNGPSLGTQNVNPFTLAQAIGSNNQLTFIAVAATNTTQATCTTVGTATVTNVTTVASSGAVCLPTATAGREIFLMNNGANTLNIFGSNTPFTSGTQDTINGTTGSTAYQGATTTNLVVQCVAYANGVWGCTSGH